MSAPHQQIHELRQKLTDLADDLASLERLLAVDVPSSLNKIRFITEKVLLKLCRDHGVKWGDAEATLERMIGPLQATGHVPKNVALYVRTIQTNTSPGSHYQEESLSASHVSIAQSALVEFLLWYYHSSEEAITVARATVVAYGAPPATDRRNVYLAAAAVGGLVLLLVLVVAWNWPNRTHTPDVNPQSVPVGASANPPAGNAPAGTPASAPPANSSTSAAKPERDDLARLQGRWLAVSQEEEGKRQAMAEGDFAIEFRGQEMLTYDGKHKPTTARAVVRSDQSPKALDLVTQLPGEGERRKNRLTVSYRFIGDDRLEIAFPKGDGFESSTAAQPKGFDTTAEKIDVLTFERK